MLIMVRIVAERIIHLIIGLSLFVVLPIIIISYFHIVVGFVVVESTTILLFYNNDDGESDTLTNQQNRRNCELPSIRRYQRWHFLRCEKM